MAHINPIINDTWQKALQQEFEKPYFTDIKHFLQNEKKQGKTIYPPSELIFNAFNSTPFDKVKVVILGQDPYHGQGQAHGLSFSVPEGIKLPSSLRNVYAEIERDLGLTMPKKSGNLSKWAAQGVLLLNATLTVEAKQANSHKTIGWQFFTDAVIQQLSDLKMGVVFLLWGNFAKKKAALIDGSKHHILTAGHPSFFSVKYFTGCAHFSATNTLLEQQNLAPINWQL